MPFMTTVRAIRETQVLFSELTHFKLQKVNYWLPVPDCIPIFDGSYFLCSSDSRNIINVCYLLLFYFTVFVLATNSWDNILETAAAQFTLLSSDLCPKQNVWNKWNFETGVKKGPCSVLCNCSMLDLFSPKLTFK